MREADNSSGDTGDADGEPGDSFSPPEALWPAPPSDWAAPSDWPAPPAGGGAGRRGEPRRRGRLAAVIALIVVGLIAIGGGSGGLAWTHARKPSLGQIATAGQRENAVQWRWLTAGQLFPAKIGYSSTSGASTDAILIGIAPPASCSAAFDAAMARVLDAGGCVTVLRATYADATGTALATVGVVVMPSTQAANQVLTKINNSTGLLPVSFPGTIAAGFTLRARETMGSQDTGGEYLIFYASGYADGRKTEAVDQNIDGGTADEWLTTDLPDQVANALGNTLSVPADPCDARGVRC